MKQYPLRIMSDPINLHTTVFGIIVNGTIMSWVNVMGANWGTLDNFAPTSGLSTSVSGF